MVCILGMSGFLDLFGGRLLQGMMIFRILGSDSLKLVMVIGIEGWVTVGIGGMWVVVERVQGSRWHWGEGGRHWSCTGWT